MSDETVVPPIWDDEDEQLLRESEADWTDPETVDLPDWGRGSKCRVDTNV